MKSSSEGASVLFDHPFFSLDTSKTPKFALKIKNKDSNNSVVEITTNNSMNQSNNNSFACYPNEVISSESIMSSTKSKVPDILMINKYYGLIPQKFTISSRKTANSTPSSAGSSSRRCTKSVSTNKPRAKSSTHHQNRNERKSADESRGFRSENDSPEPIKMILVTRNTSAGECASPVDPFGPVTKKMSVERYKKWRNCGGGKTRNMSMRSSGDIGQTLSLLDNGLPGGSFNGHANNRVSSATEFTTNRRVIKIDLNRVSSWDEENYRITTSSMESSTRGENKEREMKVVNPTASSTPDTDLLIHENRNIRMASNNNNSSYSSSCDYSFSSSTCYDSRSRSSSQEKSSPIYSNTRLDNNGSYTTCFVNNDNDCDSLVMNGGHEEQTTFMSSSIIDASVERTTESSSQNITTVKDSSAFNSCGTSVEMSSSIRKESISDERQAVKELSETRTVDETDEDNGLNNNMSLNNSLNGSSGDGENAMKICHDKKVASMQRCGKLSSRTISFDDKILDGSGGNNETSDSGVPNSSRSVKRRPTTASARFNSKTFTTPNGFNPPSKVIPWTQQKSAGGKALTLAERRAKFQRAPSIHSSSSLSMETGEEEVLSEVESNSNHCIRPPSSAFREFRKPLHVTQPPEIPTMIAQINPNADEDIQIEIEKVALMLRKMHSMKHFSMSLDSGIEAEMVRTSSAPEEAMISPKSKNPNVPSASTDSVTIPPETNQVLNASGSESSVSSTDSHSSEDDECPNQAMSKLSRASSASLTKADLRTNNGGVEPVKLKETTPSSASFIKRRCSTENINNSSTSNHISNGTTNIVKKSSQTTSSQSLVSSNTPSSTTTSVSCTGSSSRVARRPPLRKAVSISCEQELLKTDGDHKRNEVNFNANDNGKSPRPKTATAVNFQHHQRSNVSGTRSIHNNNYQHRQNSISSSRESHHATTTTALGASAGSGSQGSRNRKILIKKALMEINQSSVNMRKKWETLGRPRTAPGSEKSNNAAHHVGIVGSQQHPRKPLKASPFPISGNGRMGLSSSGKSASKGGGKTNGEIMEDEKITEKSGHTGQIQRSSSEAPAEQCSSSLQQQQLNGKPGKGRTAFRQCFSLDESALLGFSLKSVNGGRIPIFEKLASTESTESCPSSIMEDEISFLSSKKREQCLKVYEKMVKTGCSIKLETVFRGMLTPSEYRAFMREAERASQEDEEDEEASNLIAENCLPEEGDVSTGEEDAAHC